jgi:hypothetical protein
MAQLSMKPPRRIIIVMEEEDGRLLYSKCESANRVDISHSQAAFQPLEWEFRVSGFGHMDWTIVYPGQPEADIVRRERMAAVAKLLNPG